MINTVVLYKFDISINIRNTEEAVWGPQYSPRLSYWPRPIALRSLWWPRGFIVAWILPLRCILLWLPNYINVYAIILQKFSHFGKREVLQEKYSQPPILPSPHFQWVVNIHVDTYIHTHKHTYIMNNYTHTIIYIYTYIYINIYMWPAEGKGCPRVWRFNILKPISKEIWLLF